MSKLQPVAISDHYKKAAAEMLYEAIDENPDTAIINLMHSRNNSRRRTMAKPKANPKKPPKVIPIKNVVKSAPITTLLAKPKSLQPDHYLLQTLITLWKLGRITAEELDAAYFDMNKAESLVFNVS